jgi:hypothetical protein
MRQQGGDASASTPIAASRGRTRGPSKPRAGDPPERRRRSCRRPGRA